MAKRRFTEAKGAWQDPTADDVFPKPTPCFKQTHQQAALNIIHQPELRKINDRIHGIIPLEPIL